MFGVVTDYVARNSRGPIEEFISLKVCYLRILTKQNTVSIPDGKCNSNNCQLTAASCQKIPFRSQDFPEFSGTIGNFWKHVLTEGYAEFQECPECLAATLDFGEKKVFGNF